MTITDPIAGRHTALLYDDCPRETGVEMSQEDLVAHVREMREQAHRAGRRLPGRPALAEAIGVSPYRIRRALEDIARDDQRAVHAAAGEPAGRIYLLANNADQPAPGFATSEPAQSAPDGARSRGPGEPIVSGPATDREMPLPRPAPPCPSPPGSDSAASTAVSGSRASASSVDQHRAPDGARGFYLASAMTLFVSMNTSWRYFEYDLHITDLYERLVMFTVLEVALLACGWGMRANVKRTGRPGTPRLIAWLLCGTSGYMAWQLSGLTVGIARVALGPALGLVMLHLALGIEIRARTTRATSWARIGRELRERLLSRLGLSDDERDALARTRDRAGRRAARLSVAKNVWFRTTRVARALRTSNVAHESTARRRMLAELAVIRHATDLATLQLPSPWATRAGEPRAPRE